MYKKLSFTALLVGLLLCSSWALASKTDQGPQLPDPDQVIECLEYCGIIAEVEGFGEFSAKFRGTLAAETGQRFNDNGKAAVPITVLGSSMRAYVDGLGETMMWLDKSRPISGSFLREKVAGGSFPAVQEMRTHIFFSTEAYPGRTFRSKTPFTVRTEEMKSFPPRGAVFELAGPVEFEDVDDPGPVMVRLLSGTAIVGGH